MTLIIIFLILLAIGLAGLVRGRVDTSLLSSRYRSLVPFIVGAVGLFAVTAPPWVLSESPDIRVTIPPGMDTVLTGLERDVAPLVAVRAGVAEEQKSAYPTWESQVTAAQNEAAATLARLPDLLATFGKGDLDRFTMWARLAVMTADLEQAALKLHDLTPPSVLDLSDRKLLETALTDLRSAIHAAKAGVVQIQRFASTTDRHYIQQAQAHMDSATQRMNAGAAKLAQTKRRLGAA